MHTINLKNYNLRTDLVIDDVSKKSSEQELLKTVINKKNVKLEEIEIDEKLQETFNKKKGIYKTITFKDITDKDNFKEVEEVLIDALKKTYEDLKIKESSNYLIIGLGNEKSTPDSLGPKTIDHILVTRHLFSLGEVENGYQNVASFKPSVTGMTGIETKDLISAIVEKIKPDILIIIDALASSAIERLNKTIQITTAGINPGSGIGNNRVEISEKTLNIPVIAIGIPTVVDASTIVNDTLQLLIKQISYKIANQNNAKLKLVSSLQDNYENHQENLSKKEKEDLLGMVGLLEEDKLKKLLLEVLLPLNYNLMVTPKEIDYLIEKLGLLIANGINKSIHKHFNPTN